MKFDKKTPEQRRKFLHICGRFFAIGAIFTLIGFSIPRTQFVEKDFFWQIDPELCIACGLCETDCVLTPSAVKAVHAKKVCGYCDLCGGYYRANVRDLNTAAENLMCPTGAITRTYIEDPYFEYNFIEELCIACGKCVAGCNAFGNGAMYLQIKQELCKNCNECELARICPANAIKRVPISKVYHLKE